MTKHNNVQTMRIFGEIYSIFCSHFFITIHMKDSNILKTIILAVITRESLTSLAEIEKNSFPKWGWFLVNNHMLFKKNKSVNNLWYERVSTRDNSTTYTHAYSSTICVWNIFISLMYVFKYTSTKLVNIMPVDALVTRITRHFSGYCARSRYQGQGQVITSHRYCGTILLICRQWNIPSKLGPYCHGCGLGSCFTNVLWGL